MERVARFEVHALDIGLVDPFVIASTRLETVCNVAVCAVLADGVRGWGEIATLPPVTVEDQDTALAAARSLQPAAVGPQELTDWLEGELPGLPAVRAGLEMAVIDAWARGRRQPLHRWFGRADASVRTDITLPICTPERAATLARQWATAGFDVLKCKVGTDPADDLARLAAIGAAHPRARLVLDANEGWTVEQTLDVVRALRASGRLPVLLEQPVPRDDLDGLARLTREAGVPVAADEACHSPQDARVLARAGCASVLNIKLAKCGVGRALEIAAIARAHGLGLMIGGMVETRLGMGFAAHLVAGLGGFDFVDLDTPHLLTADPVVDGTPLRGPTWLPETIAAGHGGRIDPPTPTG